MSQVILISGKQGAGKTTLADHLVTVYPNSIRLSFADPMRSLISGMLASAKEIGLDLPEKPPMRSLLQFLGTEWGRKEIEDLIWVNYAKKRTLSDKYTTYIIDDTRFKNEFDAFPNAIRIRLACPEAIRKQRAKSWGNPYHLSEIDLDSYTDHFNKIFDTSGAIDKTFSDVSIWLKSKINK